MRAERGPTTPDEWKLEILSVAVGNDYGDAWLQSAGNRYLRPLIQPGRRILDAGCGYGRHVVAFAERGATVVGVDFSPISVGLTRSELQRQDFAQATAVPGDILALGFGGNRFDLYTSFGVYEHFHPHQHRLLFAEAYRVLKPGGLIYIEVPQWWSLWTPRRAARYWYHRFVPPKLVWQRNLSRSYVIRCAERAGFATVESHVLDTWSGFRRGLSLDDRKLACLPNPFHPLAGLGRWLAGICERREWLGHTLVYIGRKPAGEEP